MNGISRFFWMTAPIGVFMLLLALELTLPRHYYGYIIEENGFLELLQFFVMIAGAGIAAHALSMPGIRVHYGLMGWFTLALLGCIYIAGEEISWGQQFFKWATPDHWALINDQQETNLHNTSSWLDQKPRAIIEAGVVIGGLVLPLLLGKLSGRYPQWLKTITPPREMGIIALIYLVVKVTDKTDFLTHTPAFGRASEITELYIYYFIALYLYWLSKCHRQ